MPAKVLADHDRIWVTDKSDQCFHVKPDCLESGIPLFRQNADARIAAPAKPRAAAEFGIFVLEAVTFERSKTSERETKKSTHGTTFRWTSSIGGTQHQPHELLVLGGGEEASLQEG